MLVLRGKQLNFGKEKCSKERTTKQAPLSLMELTAGWILVNDANDTLCSKTLDTLKKNGLAEGVIEFKSGKEITEKYPMFDGPMDQSVGYYNPASVPLN